MNNKRHKHSLSLRQIKILDELMDVDKKDRGICYHDSNGGYNKEIKEDLDLLKQLGFVSEYISESYITPTSSQTTKSWTITYHGIAFIYAFHSGGL